ncbi:hypothetical protein JKP88DRAFT_300632 [Tribonema minus]|uniref:Atg6 BARA domain-containing protein n=1 Tax=Tribonema minus TaxID=303371 RepID=A0A836CKE4_9STRA|nr:hypothetical protein JKP88DRAFT_300632 [Tribonema minus]
MLGTCCRCGEADLVDDRYGVGMAQRGADESFVVLPPMQPVISESYFGAPASTSVAHELAIAGSMVHISHEGLSHHVRRTTRVHLHAFGPRLTPEKQQPEQERQSPRPVCRQCCEAILRLIDQEARRATADIAAYRIFQSQLLDTCALAPGEGAAAAALRGELALLREALATTRQEHDHLAAQLRSLAEREADAARETVALLKGARAAEAAAAARRSASAQRLAACRRLAAAAAAQAAQPPVLATVFRIVCTPAAAAAAAPAAASTSAPQRFGFGGATAAPSINGLRLARESDDRVHLDWAELAAAWGQAAQAAVAMANAAGFVSRAWRVVPLTAAARILRLKPISDGSSGGSSSDAVDGSGSKRGGGGGGSPGDGGGTAGGGGSGGGSGGSAASAGIAAVHVLAYDGDRTTAQSRLDAAIAAFAACAGELLQHLVAAQQQRRGRDGGHSSSSSPSSSSSSSSSGAHPSLPPHKLSGDGVLDGIAAQSLKSRKEWRAWIRKLAAVLQWMIAHAAAEVCFA